MFYDMSDRRTFVNLLKSVCLTPLVVVAVLLTIAEDYLWGGLVALGQWAGRLPAVQKVERRIAALPPAAAGAAVLAPVALIIPVKFFAVWVMATGRVLLGLTVLIAAKLVGTALVARIYTLCEPALSTVSWFVHLRARIMDIKDWAHAKLESWGPWRRARMLMARLRSA